MKWQITVRRQGTSPTEYYAEGMAIEIEADGRRTFRLTNTKDGAAITRPEVILYPGVGDLVIVERRR